ncbi:hypothetical protein JTB14_029751 [Gonioctena quinquepunctata]|nr:hypothetical protein JTB14_029751 [Gonioctena quinquepunctata]
MAFNKPSKKKIKVRRASLISIGCEADNEDDYYIPVAAHDSRWIGISLREPARVELEHANGSMNSETEVRMIDLNNKETTPPLLMLFPDLRKEDCQIQTPILNGEISTSSLTKLLNGKKAKMTLLKPCRKILYKQSELSRVDEDSESDESIYNKEKKPSTLKKDASYSSSSHDGDISDITSFELSKWN